MYYFTREKMDGEDFIVTTPVAYWEKHGCVSDEPDAALSGLMEAMGGSESCDSTWEALDMDKLEAALESHPSFARNDAFDAFLASHG